MGCGFDGYKHGGEKVTKTVSLDYSSNYSKKNLSAAYKDDTADMVLDNGTAGATDTSVSSGYYLSLGVLDENVEFNGTERNKAEMAVAGKKIIFPQGKIKSISIKTW